MSILKILVTDDDPRMRQMVKEYLSFEGHEVHTAGDAESALKLIAFNEYSVILLDVMMPGMDGFKLCQKIRQTSDVPIIMITAKGEEYDKLHGFELGVDDYVVKPFSPRELAARLKAVTRRRGLSDDKSIIAGSITIDKDARMVKIVNETVNLTPKEFDLLLYLVQNQGKALSRNAILSAVWGFDFFNDTRTVDTHIKTLRERLGECRNYITTVWGIGYKLEVKEVE